MGPPPPILRYLAISSLLLLPLFFDGCQCVEGILQSAIKSDPVDGYLKNLDVFHIDDQCRMARFGYHENFYKMDKAETVQKPVDVDVSSHDDCQRKKHSLFVTSEGEKYYEVQKEETKNSFQMKINTYQILFSGGKRDLEDVSNPAGSVQNPGDDTSFDADVSNCFIDLGSLYCLVGVKMDATSPKEYRVFRFTKKKDNKFEQTALYNFQIIHGGKPYHILQDSQSGHIGVIYYPFDGHESNTIDVRSLYGFLRRGALITSDFNSRYAIGMSSKNRVRYIVAHPVGGSGPNEKKYSYFRVPFGHPGTSTDNSEIANWDALARNGRKVFGFFKDSIPDLYKLGDFTSRGCIAMIQKVQQCHDDIEAIKGVRLILIIVCCFLLLVFLLFLGFLMYYLIFCVVTKRRRRRKRKHRKHRKHRKATVTPIGEPDNNDEVDIDPDTAIQEEKPPENAFVKKVKELGGVDYSSSSSEDPEHSQAYFSARDQFDTKASTAVNASTKTSKKDTNKNDDNKSKQSQADTPVTGGGATPEEHDLAATGGAQGPRSVYMKPKKKKK